MRTMYETLCNGATYAKVVGRNAYKEYVVKFYSPARIIGPSATYFTEDIADACATADAMVFGKTAQ